MKNIKIYLIGFILILSFSFILQGTNSIINEQDNKDNRNVVSPLTASNSVLYEWNHTWGGADAEHCHAVAVDSSGNIYLGGDTYSFATGLYYTDMAIVKYDSSGVKQWNRTWGGSDLDEGYGVAVDSFDNVYLTGSTYSFGAGYGDMVLVKYNGNGVQQWNRTWGGTADDYSLSMAMDSSDNVYLAGYTDSFGAGSFDMVLVKYDSSGVLQWSRTWGGSGEDGALGVTADSSGNIYLAGGTSSFGGNDMVLVKYDGNGVQQWNRTWAGGNLYLGEGVAVDSLNNVYVTGNTNNFGAGSFDMVLVKYDSSGVKQWNRTWGGSDLDLGFGVAVDSSDNVYLAGGTASFGAGLFDMVLVKYDENGVLQWNRTWGGSDEEVAFGIEIDSSDNIYLAGDTESFGAGLADMVLVKYVVEEKEEDKEKKIFGYDLLLFISAIGVIIAISLKKKYK